MSGFAMWSDSEPDERLIDSNTTACVCECQLKGYDSEGESLVSYLLQS